MCHPRAARVPSFGGREGAWDTGRKLNASSASAIRHLVASCSRSWAGPRRHRRRVPPCCGVLRPRRCATFGAGGMLCDLARELGRAGPEALRCATVRGAGPRTACVTLRQVTPAVRRGGDAASMAHVMLKDATTRDDRAYAGGRMGYGRRGHLAALRPKSESQTLVRLVTQARRAGRIATLPAMPLVAPPSSVLGAHRLRR